MRQMLFLLLLVTILPLAGCGVNITTGSSTKALTIQAQANAESQGLMTTQAVRDAESQRAFREDIQYPIVGRFLPWVFGLGIIALAILVCSLAVSQLLINPMVQLTKPQILEGKFGIPIAIVPSVLATLQKPDQAPILIDGFAGAQARIAFTGQVEIAANAAARANHNTLGSQLDRTIREIKQPQVIDGQVKQISS